MYEPAAVCTVRWWHAADGMQHGVHPAAGQRGAVLNVS